MKLLGRASASQVIAAYRHDFVLKQSGIRWPDASEVPLDFLPLERLNRIAAAARPSLPALEAVWDLYECSGDEIGDMQAMWGDPPYSRTVRQLADDIRRGDYPLSVDTAARLATLRADVNKGTMTVGHLVALRASAMTLYLPSDMSQGESLCLVEGHHRVLAMALEHKLSDRILVLAGTRPVPLGVAVLNGHAKP